MGCANSLYDRAMAHDPSFIVRRAVLTGAARLPHGGLALLGVSGGADSLALAAAAAAAGAPDVRFGAVVIDHGLQEGSAQVAERAAAQCRDLGLDPVVEAHVHVLTGPGSGGLEMAARMARRRALLDAAEEHGADAIWLAHTADDQAETVLLGLLRGSGPRSLAGMRAWDGIWGRPLLTIPRSVVRASLADHGLPAFEDPHNEDERFSRARVRHRVLPVLERELGGHVASQLVRSAELFRDDTDALDAMAASAWEAMPADEATAAPALDLAGLRALPRALRTRVVRLALLDAGCLSPEKDHIDAVEHLAMEPRARGPVRVPGGLQVRKQRDRGRLVIEPRS